MNKIDIKILSNTIIGTNKKIRKNVDFDILEEKNKIRYKGIEINYKIEKLEVTKKFNLREKSLIKFIDSEYKDKFAMSEKTTNVGENKYIIFNDENEVCLYFKGKNLKMNDIEEKSFWEMSIKKYEYYNNILNNRISTLPYNGENFYVPSSSLKGSLFQQFKIKGEEILKEDNFERGFPDIMLTPEQIEIVNINQVKRADMEDSTKNENFTRVIKNQTNVVMSIKKDVTLTADISDLMYDKLKDKAVEITNITKQKLKFIINKIDDLLKGVDKEIKNKKNSIERLNGVEETKKEMDNLKTEMQIIIEKEYNNNQILCFLGGNKGFQAMSEEKVEKYGIYFVNSKICGLMEIQLGGKNES
ncbi:MAG: hypothetical protein ACK5HR_04555 [Mycoplasmatales bacterium]